MQPTRKSWPKWVIPIAAALAGLAVGTLATYLLLQPRTHSARTPPVDRGSPTPSSPEPSPAGTAGGLDLDIPPSGFLTFGREIEFPEGEDDAVSIVAIGPYDRLSGAFGEVVFGQDHTLPEGLDFNFEISSTAAAEALFENIRDILVTEVVVSGDRLVGTVRNHFGEVITGPVGVEVACLDQSGRPLAVVEGFLAKNDRGRRLARSQPEMPHRRGAS